MTLEARGAATRPWYSLSVEEAERLLGTSSRGLSSEEARRRFAEWGPNEIVAERAIPWWRTLLHQFADPLIYILVIAALVTLALGYYSDTAVIVVALLLNAVIGFTQERRAHQAMRALARLSAPHCDVVRAGRVHPSASRDVVPGDVVVLSSGSRVPADLRIFRAQELEIDESALTGESVPVSKTTEALEGEALVPGDQANMAFSGTIVTRGRGMGYAVHTGPRTELGRIATAIHAAGATATPFEERMAVFGKQVGAAILLLTVTVGSIGLLRGMSPPEVLLVGIALVVSAIPESLPVILTVTFAVGVRRMARRNALIRSLPAVETLGSATVIGSDKTGTLTKNEMTVERIWAGGVHYMVTGSGYHAAGEIQRNGERVDQVRAGPLEKTLLGGILANEADACFLTGAEPVGDPTELALLASAAKAGWSVQRLRDQYVQLDILPFESERRFMATLNEGPEGRFIYAKGAPEAILARCDFQLDEGGESPVDVHGIQQVAAELAGRGLRVLAVALKRHPEGTLSRDAVAGGFTFAGLQGMEDPIRPEALRAVADAHAAGIRVLMLTGDHAATATAVGRELGLDANKEGAIEGSALNEISDADLDVLIRKIDIYARVAPEHKLRIVERLKAQGHVVAVTGDGINDAPALRAAHIGIAMGLSGTDVAREASDLVLADDNFATITAAVEEGRVVFANIRKVTFFLLSTTAGDILSILVALVVGWPIPFTPAQILWVNLVTNGVQDLALAFEPPERGLLKRPPRPRREGVVTWRVLERFAGVGAILSAGTLGMFWWTWTRTGDLDLARTAAVTQIVVFNFYHVFNCRSLDASLLTIPPFSNRFLFFSVLGAAAAQLAVLHVPVFQGVFRMQPVSMGDWALMLLIGATVILGGELDKWRNRRRSTPIG